MGGRDDTSLASILLTNRLVERGADPLTPKVFWELVNDVKDPALLLGMSVSEISSRVRGLDGERIRKLLDASTQLAFELERLDQAGIRLLSVFDEGFPGVLRERLQHRTPPSIYVVGPPELMTGNALGVVGSRDISPVADQVARDAARMAAAEGRELVSGAARGTDQAAMNAAFEAGGTVVGILGDSLDRRIRQPDIRRAIGEDRLCLVSHYKPDAGFTPGRAMERNKLIYALTAVTVVVASGLTGGTWEGAKEALRWGFSRVAVWTGEGAGPGNQPLVEQGAIAVASIDELRATLHDEALKEGPRQLSLGFGGDR